MNSLIPIHIAGGGAAILAGYAAVSLRKGSRRHGRAGTIFVIAMLVMATAAVPMALADDQAGRGIATGAVLTMYLVVTSWAAARNRDGRFGRVETAAMLVAMTCLALFVTFAAQALRTPDGQSEQFGAPFYFVWAGFAALAVTLDLNFLLRGTLSRLQRLRRHLWRMSTAFFVATGSFFLGQQKVMPEWMVGPWLFAPALAPLVLMLFWLVRVRFRPFGPEPRRTVPVTPIRAEPSPAGV